MLQPRPQNEIIVNGQREPTVAETLAELLDERGLTDARVATALNGHFIPATGRATTQLKAGDRVEIVSARQGG